MIQVSSSVADAVVPRYATYGATKAFNNIFASLIANQLERSSTT
jgi:short-subunit dehydrogenase